MFFTIALLREEKGRNLIQKLSKTFFYGRRSVYNYTFDRTHLEDWKLWQNWTLMSPVLSIMSNMDFIGHQASRKKNEYLTVRLTASVDNPPPLMVSLTVKYLFFYDSPIKVKKKKNIARIANAVQVTICLLVSTSVYQCLLT